MRKPAFNPVAKKRTANLKARLLAKERAAIEKDMAAYDA